MIRTSTDGFTTERVVMASGEGHVIYASAPAVSGEGLVVHFSTLSYETRNLEGWDLLHYNPEEGRVLGHVDLSDWIPDGCVTNRPTGIGVSEAGLVTLETARFPDGFRMDSNTDRSEFCMMERPRPRTTTPAWPLAHKAHGSISTRIQRGLAGHLLYRRSQHVPVLGRRRAVLRAAQYGRLRDPQLHHQCAALHRAVRRRPEGRIVIAARRAGAISRHATDKACMR